MNSLKEYVVFHNNSNDYLGEHGIVSDPSKAKLFTFEEASRLCMDDWSLDYRKAHESCYNVIFLLRF